MQWNPDLLHKFIAPEIARFTAADIPDLTSVHSDAQNWLANHFLNNVLRASFHEPMRQYAINLLYRAQVSFNRYAQARQQTQEFLRAGEPHNPSIRRYFDAISSWEAALLNWQIAIDLWIRCFDVAVFRPGDGSKDSKAYGIANQIKHCADAIRRGDHVGEVTVPLWLANDGFHTRDNLLSYSEFAQLITELIAAVERLRDPLSLRQSIEAADNPPDG